MSPVSRKEADGTVEKVVKTKRFKAILGVVIGLAVIGLAILAYKFGYTIFSEKQGDDMSGVNVNVSITEDMSDSDIADMLEKNGLITSPFYFKIQLKIYTSDDYGVIPGDYVLNTGMSSKQIIKEISGNKTVTTTVEETLGIYTTEAQQE